MDRGPQIYEGGLELSDVRALPVADLSVGYSPREMKVDAGHVAALMEVVDLLPPVIVDHRTMTVIDGVHRLEAFRRVGRSHIDALMFNGKDSEALVVAIQANVKHGKPLSRGERRAAARSLLHAFPERSDRWAGEVCGLSHTTVALIRRSLNIADTRVRTGRDGRRRPVDRLAGQMAVARVIADNPTTTVRQAAGAAGVAPSTVHRARARLFGCENSLPVPSVATAQTPEIRPAGQTPEAALAVQTREEVAPVESRPLLLDGTDRSGLVVGQDGGQCRGRSHSPRQPSVIPCLRGRGRMPSKGKSLDRDRRRIGRPGPEQPVEQAQALAFSLDED